MREVVVVSAIRSPFGRYGGALSEIRPDDLAAKTISALMSRNSIPPEQVDDVFWGAANQAGEDNRNVARMAALLAGLPIQVGGVTVNRLCGSGLQAIISAAREIQVGAADVMIAGGSESMTRAPYVMLKPSTAYQRGEQTVFDSTLGWRMVNPCLAERYPPISLGETAENVATEYGIGRGEQDAFALASHRKAAEAQDNGRLAREIVPISVPVGRGDTKVIVRDEGPRHDTSLEKLARLPAAFVKDGTVTAGNSSTLNDGAAAVLLASREAADDLHLPKMARFLDGATAGVDPSVMGMGPVPATRKLLERTGILSDQLDVIEINEAFASQVLACVRELGLDMERVNRNGGAIALGHPLGASGVRLVTTLVHELQHRSAQYGLATMCIGVGQGISALFERVL